MCLADSDEDIENLPLPPRHMRSSANSNTFFTFSTPTNTPLLTLNPNSPTPSTSNNTAWPISPTYSPAPSTSNNVACIPTLSNYAPALSNSTTPVPSKTSFSSSKPNVRTSRGQPQGSHDIYPMSQTSK